MAFDEQLANRVRSRLAKQPGLVEKRMFGGLAFMVGGNMSVGVHGDELIVRLAPGTSARALAQPGARAFDLSGKMMKGWIMVGGPAIRSDAALARWVQRGVSFASSLPRK